MDRLDRWVERCVGGRMAECLDEKVGRSVGGRMDFRKPLFVDLDTLVPHA